MSPGGSIIAAATAAANAVSFPLLTDGKKTAPFVPGLFQYTQRTA